MRNVLEYLENMKNKKEKGVFDEFGFSSYEEIERNSKAIATSLVKLKLSKKPIPVFMEKSRMCLETFFGIVYAGCCYTLLNPEFPSSRLKNVIEVMEAKVIITDEMHYENIKNLFPNLKILKVEELKKEKIKEKALENIRTSMIDLDPLYLNFTSGSTGTPKGVLISHRSVIDFIDVFTNLFHITNDDVIANQAPFDFDVSVKDIYSALKVGANLVIIPRTYFSSPAKLIDLLCDYKVTTLIWAVSALCLISTFHGLDYKTPESINKVLFSGEVMPLKHLKIWMEHLKNATFVNLYGPTEITCNCTYHVIDRTREYEKIPIGIAFPNEEVFLLNEENEIVTNRNEPGEICVRGTALTLGYYNNEIETNKRLIQNPTHHYYHDMIYKTGDLGMYNNQLELVFQGRKDFQIKYMGHRIELEEIDRASEKILGIERSCTLFMEAKNRLVCYYIGVIEEKELSLKLKEVLPIYMIPTKYIKLTEFPLTKNGKIDRKDLERRLDNETIRV